MEEKTAIAKNMARQISKLLTETEHYEAYQRARVEIYADKDLYRKIREFNEKHLRFLYAVREGRATFDEERYLSQEFHKLMLNKNVNTYFETGLFYVELLAEIYSTSLGELHIDLDFIEV